MTIDGDFLSPFADLVGLLCLQHGTSVYTAVNPLHTQTGTELSRGYTLEPGEPLHQRAPTHDEFGKPVSDFMMLIPGLKRASSVRLNSIVTGLQAVLGQNGDVLFVDLNISRNVLWVSVRAIPGIIPEIAGAIQARVPEALIVGSPRFHS